jgi:branched-chain amino acid transport system permease protein
MTVPSTTASPASPPASAEPMASPARSMTDALAPRLLGTRTRLITLGLGVLAIVAFFFTANDNWMSIVNYTLTAAIAALALNVLSGYAGQVSLGIAFFMAIGAYTAAFLGGTPPRSSHDLMGLGLSFVIWLPAAGIVAAVVGALVGPTALRLKGFYLGIVSLGLIFIGLHLFKNVPALTSITGGAEGRSFPAPAIGGFSFAQQNDLALGFALTKEQAYFLLLVPVLAVCALFVANVMRSRAGRAMQAVRDNETAAAIMGVNIFQAKMGAFILSSFLAGIAGALYASHIGYSAPDSPDGTTGWTLLLSIQFVAAIIIGGIASVWGSILGAAFVFALPLVLANLSLVPQYASSGGLSSGTLNAMIYGALVIVFLLFQPGGIVGLLRGGWFRVRVPRFLGLALRRKGGEPANTLSTTR